MTAARGTPLAPGAGVSAQGLGMVVKHLVADAAHTSNFHHDPRRTVKGLPYLSQADKSALSRAGTDKLRKLAEAARQLRAAHQQFARARQPMPRNFDRLPSSYGNIASAWGSRGALPQSNIGPGNPDRVGGGVPVIPDVSSLLGEGENLADQMWADLSALGIKPDQAPIGPGSAGSWGFHGLGGGRGSKGPSNAGDSFNPFPTPGGGSPLSGPPDLSDIANWGSGERAIMNVIGSSTPATPGTAHGFGMGGAADYLASYGYSHPGAEVSGIGDVIESIGQLVTDGARAVRDFLSPQQEVVQAPMAPPGTPSAPQQSPQPTVDPGREKQLRHERADRAYQKCLDESEEGFEGLNEAHCDPLRPAWWKSGPVDDVSGAGNAPIGGGVGGPREMPSDDSTGSVNGPGGPRLRIETMPADDNTTNSRGPGGPRATYDRPAPDDVGPGNPHSRLAASLNELLAAARMVGR